MENLLLKKEILFHFESFINKNQSIISNLNDGFKKTEFEIEFYFIEILTNFIKDLRIEVLKDLLVE